MLSLSSRIFRSLSVLSLLALLSGLAACGTPVTSENFGKLYHDELCNQIENCCKGKTLSGSGKDFFGASLQECTSLYEKDRTVNGHKINFKKSIDDLLNNPNRAFSADNATSCLAAIKTTPCATASLAALPLSCNLVFQGKLTEGAACKEYLDCAPGHLCTPAQDGSLKCLKTLADGETCGVSATSLCGITTSYCDFTDSKCKPLKTKGETCTGPDCGLGLICTPNKKCEDVTGASFCK